MTVAQSLQVPTKLIEVDVTHFKVKPAILSNVARGRACPEATNPETSQ